MGGWVIAKSQLARQVQLPDTQQLERWRDAFAKHCLWDELGRGFWGPLYNNYNKEPPKIVHWES